MGTSLLGDGSIFFFSFLGRRASIGWGGASGGENRSGGEHRSGGVGALTPSYSFWEGWGHLTFRHFFLGARRASIGRGGHSDPLTFNRRVGDRAFFWMEHWGGV